MVTQEDLMFLPYVDRNLGRIFIRGCQENTRLFIREFRDSEFGSRLLAEDLATSAHLDRILEETQSRFGHDDVNMQEFTATAKSLWMAGDLEPAKRSTPPQEPEIERDRLGRPLSPKAKQWKRWQEWCNDPNTRMSDIQNLRRTNLEFAEFFANQSAHERAGGVGDVVEAFGTQAVRQDRSVKITQELNDFAFAYRAMSATEVRKNSNLATNPHAVEFNRNVNLASRAGIL